MRTCKMVTTIAMVTNGLQQLMSSPRCLDMEKLFYYIATNACKHWCHFPSYKI